MPVPWGWGPRGQQVPRKALTSPPRSSQIDPQIARGCPPGPIYPAPGLVVAVRSGGNPSKQGLLSDACAPPKLAERCATREALPETAFPPLRGGRDSKAPGDPPAAAEASPSARIPRNRNAHPGGCPMPCHRTLSSASRLARAFYTLCVRRREPFHHVVQICAVRCATLSLPLPVSHPARPVPPEKSLTQI